MLNTCAILTSVKCFNDLKVGDRIFYTKNGHAMTRRVLKKGTNTVIVNEDGKSKRVRYDRIFMA